MKDKFKIHYSAISSIGKVRTNNEDNLFLDGKYLCGTELDSIFQTSGKTSGEASLFAVCDGMGGEEFGEEASLIAVQTLDEHRSRLFDKRNELQFAIGQYILDANNRICQETLKTGKRIGTTLAIILFRQNLATIANLGDSRIYLFRQNEIKQLSEDHTQVQTLIRTGVLTKEAAMNHPAKNQLTQHLGIFSDEMVIEPLVQIDQIIQDGDRWLICSDGLTDLLSSEDISHVFRTNDSIAETCTALVQIAMERGAHDNLTCIVIHSIKQGFFTSLPK